MTLRMSVSANGMADLMYAHEGIGLAAPQVGSLQRLIMADIGEGLLTLANPEILEKEGQRSLVGSSIRCLGGFLSCIIHRKQLLLTTVEHLKGQTVRSVPGQGGAPFADFTALAERAPLMLEGVI